MERKRQLERHICHKRQICKHEFLLKRNGGNAGRSKQHGNTQDIPDVYESQKQDIRAVGKQCKAYGI